MDDRLKEALSFSEYRQTLNNQLDLLKFNTQNALMISLNGGTFDIDKELINFVELLTRRGHTEVVLIDKDDKPIKIQNLSDFLEDLLSKYFEVVNDYHTQYEIIRRKRSTQAILDLNS